MTGFDAEWYLRRSGEDVLPAAQDIALLADRARALIAVGKVDPPVADSVVVGYQRALALRGRERHPHFRGESVDMSPAAEPSPRRTLACRDTFEATWGTVTVHYVILASDETDIGVRARLNPGIQHRHPGPTQLTVRDDQGQKITANFNGGGDRHTWKGQFHANAGLSPTTRWLELDGTRIELGPELAPARVTVEPRCDTAAPLEQRAADYLEYCLEQSFETGEPQLPEVLDALTASGALKPASPIVTAVQTTLEALTGAAGPDPSRLTPRWRSVLEGRARARQGPRGWLLVGTTTPVFDGLTVTVISLNSEREHFSVEFRASGPVSIRDWAPSVLLPILVFSAVDDLGNHYVGSPGSHSGGPRSLEGDIHFGSPLHPAAIRLDLVVSTARSRATVEIPLRFEDES